jgi:alanine racemase
MPSPKISGPSNATTILTVDLDALAANYRLLLQRAAPAQCAAVVKADGYGLGVGPVGRTLHAAGCTRFFVAHLDEAATLRKALGGAASTAEIAVLNGLMPGQEKVFRDHNLMPVLNDLGQVAQWSEECRANGAHPSILHLDTGMCRLGLPPEEQRTLFDDPQRLDGLSLTCIMSHLACADTPDHPLNRQQQADFAAAIKRLPKVDTSLAASSGIFLGPDWHFDMVRPGVSLYGVAPTPGEPNPMAPRICRWLPAQSQWPGLRQYRRHNSTGGRSGIDGFDYARYFQRASGTTRRHDRSYRSAFRRRCRRRRGGNHRL